MPVVKRPTNPLRAAILRTANRVDAPTQDRSPTEAQLRGFLAGILGGPVADTVAPEAEDAMMQAAMPAVAIQGPLRGHLKAPEWLKRIPDEYRTLLYHGTKDPELRRIPSPISEEAAYDFGIHATPEPATAGRFLQFASEDESPSILPLVARLQKTLDMPDVGMWKSPLSWKRTLTDFPPTERARVGWRDSYNPRIKTNDPALLAELQKEATRYTNLGRDSLEYDYEDTFVDWQKLVRDRLGKEGYDSIRYPNFTEGHGEDSFLMLKPEQLRSPFAKFDPRKRGVNDILASILGVGAASTLLPRKDP